jgi:hypothetical protein
MRAWTPRPSAGHDAERKARCSSLPRVSLPKVAGAGPAAVGARGTSPAAAGPHKDRRSSRQSAGTLRSDPARSRVHGLMIATSRPIERNPLVS